MDVDVEQVDAWDVAGELALEHVEVLVRVDEHRVEHEGLVGLQAVEGLSAADGEGGVVGFAGVAGKSCLALAASGTWSTSGALGAFGSSFTRSSSVATIPFVALTQSRGKLFTCLNLECRQCYCYLIQYVEIFFFSKIKCEIVEDLTKKQ